MRQHILMEPDPFPHVLRPLRLRSQRQHRREQRQSQQEQQPERLSKGLRHPTDRYSPGRIGRTVQQNPEKGTRRHREKHLKCKQVTEGKSVRPLPTKEKQKERYRQTSAAGP